MRPLMTAAAVLALVAGAVHAQGNSKDNDRGAGDNEAAASMQGGAGGKARGNAERGSNRAVASSGEDRGNKDRGNSGDRGDGNPRAGSEWRGPANAGRGPDDRGANKGRGDNERTFAVRGNGRADDVVRVRNVATIAPRGLVTGCPPGLAKKNPPCIPPGQVRGRHLRYDRPDFWGLRLSDGRYRYGDGYLMRLGPEGRIGGYIPLLGGALAVGNSWPSYYEPVALPVHYERYYGLGPYGGYRYADNVIYRVDPETAAITSIAALLTGDDFVVGQPIPAGYDVYNVPPAYRARYYDTPDSRYRYADGYIYQVDPETQLVAAAIELLAT